MGKTHIERLIRFLKGATHSTEDQTNICHGLWSKGITPSHEGLKAKELGDELGLDLDYDARTSLGHLDDIGLVEEYLPPGVRTCAIATWKDDGIVNGKVGEAAEEGIEALIDHMHDDDLPEEGDSSAVADGAGPTVRGVVADRFDLVPDAVESHPRGPGDQVERLNDAVESIEDHDDVSTRDTYGEIIFVNRAYRYRLTPAAVNLYRQ